MVSFSLLNAIDPTTIIFMVLLAVLIVALLVVPMFTNKKRAKQTEELHSSLKPGDLIKTIGGVVGTVVEIRQISSSDKEMVIETGVGDNKTTMVFDIQALWQVMSRSSTIVSAKEEPEEQPQEEPEQPAREVPEILADRQAKDEQPVAEEPANEQASVAEQPESAPETEAEVKEQVAAEPKQAKPAAAKKPSTAKKSSSNTAKKSK